MSIQSTFSAAVTGAARYLPPTANKDALLSFSVFAGPSHLSERDYVRCRLSGRKAVTLRHYIVAGKRVLISGLVRLIADGVERPYLRCSVTSIELLGGGSHPLPGEIHDEEDDHGL